MMVGLIQAGTISLTAWAPYVHSRAIYAQSSVRRFARWLKNTRLDVHALSGPPVPPALAAWAHQGWYVALDPSMWWHTSCRGRLARV